jgi:RNA-directed DNA polymerase
MHENRETSELSELGRGTDRPEKAECRATGTNGKEESDRAIIPMNQPNKGSLMGREPSAEVGEGRERTKENIGQAHTNPTQGGGKGVSQGLSGVRQAARSKKGERFTALLHHLTLKLLRASF